MTEAGSTVVSRTSSVKRKSLLSGLGIKPGTTAEPPKAGARTSTAATSKAKTATSTTKPPSATRPSKTPVSKAPTAVRASKTPVRKTPPTAIKTERVTPTSSAASSPTVSKRKSIVPSATPSPNRASPLTRRSSVNHPPVNSTSNAAKRMSTPAGLAEFTIKEKVSEQEELLEQKEKEIEKLKRENEQHVSLLEQEVEKLKKELEAEKEKGVSKEETNQQLFQIKQDTIQETENKLKAEHQQEINKLLEEQENNLKAEHQQKISKLLEEQEKKLESELSTFKAECEHMVDGLKLKNDETMQQMNLVKTENDTLKSQLQREQEEHKDDNERHASEISKLNDQIVFLDEKIESLERAQTNSYLRKVENDLSQATAALEEHRRQSQQQLEAVERRHRDEIRQLQSGTDDTAMAWLEKTRATQQEVDSLHDELRRKEAVHSEAIETLREQYEEELDKLRESCERKETEIEERSAQIESLLDRVETLQNSLEAATVRLEHTAKSSPSSSSDRDDINNANKTNSIGHEACIKRCDAQQKELNDLKAKLVEVKETHESQLNRLGKEKANAVQELRKTIAQLEERQKPMTPPPSINEENLAQIAEQHKKEMKMMHDQYQLAVDNKNRELEDYAYRVKALVASKQKETEKMDNERREEVERYEKEIEGYEIKMKELEKEIKKNQERASHWEMLHNNAQVLLEDTRRGCLVHREENEQLLKLVNQLQGEIHNGNTA
ncbi:hypothetical protein G6F35_005222 [Rhizopus arrhizus]|nr:hypothetical protein G6F35_005222 [Rhizopus arrhizus]